MQPEKDRHRSRPEDDGQAETESCEEKEWLMHRLEVVKIPFAFPKPSAHEPKPALHGNRGKSNEAAAYWPRQG